MKVLKEGPLDQGDDVDKDPHYVVTAQEHQTEIDDEQIDAEEEKEIFHESVQRAVQLQAEGSDESEDIVANSIAGSEGDVVEVLSNPQSQFLGTKGFYGNSGTAVKKKPPTKKDGPRNQPKTRGMALAKKVPEKKTVSEKVQVRRKNETKNIKGTKKRKLRVQKYLKQIQQ